MDRLKDLYQEIKRLISSRTLDAVIGPAIFLLAYSGAGLARAIFYSFLFSLATAFIRYQRKETSAYAFLGLAGSLITAGLAYLSNNLNNFFLGGILSNGGLFLLALLSMVIRRPLAALASHLSHAWPLDWYRRADVSPAYRQVTIFWALYFLLRFAIQLFFFQEALFSDLVLARTVLGWPATLLVLISSYFYGGYRLRKLGGPSVEEYKQMSPPPYQGQSKGF